MSNDGVQQVPPSQVPAARILLDVREDDEWQLGHAPDAVHIPLSELPARIDEIELDSDLYVVCRGGGRSERAVAYLSNTGIDATNVEGGMIAWVGAGLPIVTDDGAVGNL